MRISDWSSDVLFRSNIISFRNSRGDFQTDISFSLLGLTRRLALPDFIQFLENTVNTQVAVRNGQLCYKESPPFGITPHELREKVLEHRKIVEKQLPSGPANDENTQDRKSKRLNSSH